MGAVVRDFGSRTDYVSQVVSPRLGKKQKKVQQIVAIEMADVEAKATKFAVEQISRGGGERSNLNIVGVGGIRSTCVQRTRVSFIIDPHPQIVSFATSDGDAERTACLARW